MHSPMTRDAFKLMFLLVCVLILSACRADLPDPSPAPAAPADPAAVTEIQFSPTTAPDEHAAIQAAPQESGWVDGGRRQIAAGLAIEAGNLRFEEEESGGLTLKLDVCFQMPTNSDWSIFAASLRYAGTVIEEYGGDPIEIVMVEGDGTVTVLEGNRPNISQRPALENEQSRRCDTIYFWALPGAIRDAEFTFTIDGLYASRETGGPCTSELLTKAQQAMDMQAAGIGLGCSVDLVNGYAGLFIDRIPEGMTREAADEHQVHEVEQDVGRHPDRQRQTDA